MAFPIPASFAGENLSIKAIMTATTVTTISNAKITHDGSTLEEKSLPKKFVVSYNLLTKIGINYEISSCEV